MENEQFTRQGANIAIDIKNISKTFGCFKALDGISLSIHKNEIFGLLGPNGSGKTTLLRILSTLVPADQPNRSNITDGHRKCEILGFDLFKQQDEIRKIMGYVPQHDALYGDLSAMDNLIFFSEPYSIDRMTRKARIDELLKRVALTGRKNDLAKNFSGGMLKRLSIVCSLVHKPQLLFLDEITVGLDTPLRREIWDLISELKKESTIVVTTHYIPDAQNYCDRVAMIYEGHILDSGKPDEIIARYPPATDLEEVTLICQNKS